MVARSRRIHRAALHFLSNLPDRQWPCSLASFLTNYLEDYLDPDQPVVDVRPMETVVRRSMSDRQFTMYLLAAFAGFALVLNRGLLWVHCGW